MKKVLVMLLIAFVLQDFSLAEDVPFQIEDEWFCASIYSEVCYEAEPLEGGGYIIAFRDEEIVFGADGSISKSGEISETLSVEAINDGGALYYNVEDHCLRGYILMYFDGKYRCYSIDESKLVLFIDGKVISFDGDKQASYLMSDDNMYLTSGDSYVRGAIQHYSSDVFSYVMDVDPVIIDYGNGYTQNWGVPSYLFIRSEIVQ